jgi:hypothetical protein
MRKLMYIMFGGVLTLALLFGGYAAFAQTDDAATTPTPDETTTEDEALTRPFRGGRGGLGMFGGRGMGIDRDALLAEALGISVAELQAAQDEAQAAALAQAVAAGTITQEQADLMAAAHALRDFIDRDAMMAQVLGVTAEEFAAAKADGTVQELVDATGLTQEELMTAVQEAHQTVLTQAIESGIITQEQADQLQSERGFGLRGFGGGMRGGHHGGRGMGLGQGMNGDCPLNLDDGGVDS